MFWTSHPSFFRLWGRIPKPLRRRVVRLFSPSFTVGANVVVTDDQGRLLLVRHSYRAHWGLPGGLIERGEEPAVAAAREVREEVGIEVELLGDPVVTINTGFQQIDFIYRARPAPGSVAVPTSAEILEVGWFADDARPMLQSEAAAALGAVERPRH